MKTVLILIVLALLGTGSVTASAAQPGVIRHYDYPAQDKADRDLCITEHGGYPGPGGVWAGISQAELNQCQQATVWRTGKWNWDNRVLVGIEE